MSRLRKSDVGRYVFLPGDPERVPKIAKHWDKSKEIGMAGYRDILRGREIRHYMWSGLIRGEKVLACGTGIGAPALESALGFLRSYGADTFIRVGTCGAIQPNIRPGDLVIASGALRREATSSAYVDSTYPAVGDFWVLQSLVQACEDSGYRHHVGLIASTDTFYVGQGRPGFKGYLPSETRNIVHELSQQNILAFDMETSVLYVIASLRKFRAGSICAVVANRINNEMVAGAGEEICIRAANRAMRLLIDMGTV